MKVCIVSGSNRAGSESARVSSQILEKYSSIENLTLSVLDLSKNNIPMWDESIWDGEWVYSKEWEVISAQLKEADAFVFVCPEWAGMVPPQVKNLFLVASDLEFFHKPSLIVGISSGQGGSYPVAELRVSSYKNTHITWIPEQVVIRECEKFDINDGSFTANRLDFCVNVLLSYGKAMENLADDVINLGGESHLYGM